MAYPLFTDIVEALPATIPFVGPEAIARRTGKPIRARLGANESAFGPSPRVIEAMGTEAPRAWQYGDPEIYDLKQRLATHLGVGAEHIAIGEGIDGLQSLVARMFIAPGDTLVTSLGAYPTLNYHVAGCGGRIVTVPYAGDYENLGGLIDIAKRENARLLYLSNPDNPMGTFWGAAELQRFIEAVPETTLLILDEAYCETATGALPPLEPERPNIVRMRTFSKVYGLAGMRIGYAVGAARMNAGFNKLRNHFGVTRLSQAAAIAALADQEWLLGAVERVAAAREQLYAIAQDNKLGAIPSSTNFVTIDCGRDGAYALAVLQALEARGVFVRKPMAPVLDRYIRVTTGLDDALEVFAEELPHALREAAG